MDISVEGASYITLFGFLRLSQTALSSVVVTALICVAGILIGRRLHKRPGKIQVLVEKGYGMLHGMVIDTMGEHNAYWTPFICTIFLSSICGSYIGLTGFLRSTTADLSVTLTWSVMVSVLIWYNKIKRDGFLSFLKGFTEPIWVMTPMNLVSEVAQPFAMALRHFGNVAGGGVITTILYTALGLASSALLRLIAGSFVAPLLLIAVGVALFVLGRRKKKAVMWIFGIVFFLIGICGLLEYTGILTGVPILAYGIPAVFSLYFDVFSGFVQALVFTLLTMVYIAGACPPPEEAVDENGNS